jgi:HSP20 family protein
MPGLKAEDIDVELHDDHLYIRGTKKKEVEEKASLNQQERKFGVYHRRIPLEERVNPGQSEAQYKDGVLVIVLGKSAPREVSKIEVRSAS